MWAYTLIFIPEILAFDLYVYTSIIYSFLFLIKNIEKHEKCVRTHRLWFRRIFCFFTGITKNESMSFSLANITNRICSTLSGAAHADKSAVQNLSTSIDLTALTKRH